MKRIILMVMVGGCASGVGGSNPPEGITVSDAKSPVWLMATPST